MEIVELLMDVIEEGEGNSSFLCYRKVLLFLQLITFYVKLRRKKYKSKKVRRKSCLKL